MSALPANRLRVLDRGLLRPSMKADVANFVPARVADKPRSSTRIDTPNGVRDVMVNGRLALREGKITGNG